MGRSTSSFGRGKPKFKPQPTVLVVCEDTKSAITYLREAAVNFRCSALVEFVHCGKTDPLGIVKHAQSRRQSFDKVYCVIDRDEHENFDSAVDLARGLNNVTLITSFPCFEFWLILHFGYSREPIARSGNNSPGDNAVNALRIKPGMQGYDKSAEKIFDSLLDKLHLARKFSLRVMQDAIDTNAPNPSTRLHILIDQFEALGEPQKAEG